jgi:hypothetical protein
MASKNKTVSIIEKIQGAIDAVESEISTITDCLRRLALEDQAAADGIPFVAPTDNDLFSKISGAVAAANADLNAAAAAQLREQLRAQAQVELTEKQARHRELSEGLGLELLKRGATSEVQLIEHLIAKFSAAVAEVELLEAQIKAAPRFNIRGLAKRRGKAAIVSGSIGRLAIEGTATNLRFINRA